MKKLEAIAPTTRAKAATSPTRPSQSTSSKIRERHRERLAAVYIRQSNPQQVVNNRESRERQYELSDYAIALGWSSDRIIVFDDDTGQTGRTAVHRSDFHGLL